MPIIFVPEPIHRCLVDHNFDVGLNRDKSNVIVGEIWECPTCAQRWLWFGDEKATVSYPRWVQISKRASDRIIKRAGQAPKGAGS